MPRQLPILFITRYAIRLSTFSNSLQEISCGNIPTLRTPEALVSLILFLVGVTEPIMRLAIEHIRRMNGGSQAHLMRCDDGSYYVVKFKNNPQHLRTLANEMFATRVAARIGICVPQSDIVEVRSSLIENNPELMMEMPSRSFPCATGKQFGSKFPGNPLTMKIYGLMPDQHLCAIHNIDDFLGIFIFDKWTCQTDRRQAILVRQPNSSANPECANGYQAMMIDQGFCFNGGNWNFPDAPLHSLYANRRVYQNVVGIESFDPWLDRLETGLSLSALYDEALQVPPEWYGEDHEAWERLIEHLYARRTRLRELIWAARNAIPEAFPNWNKFICPMSVTKAISRANIVA